MSSCLLSGFSLTIPIAKPGLQRGEDAAVGAEIGMTHVRAFDGAGHPEGDAAKVIAGHR